MNKKLLIGFGVALLALIIVTPLLSPQGGANQGRKGTKTSAPAPVMQPPELDAASLTGTAWEVKAKELPCAVTIHLNPGGQAIATVPPFFRPIAKKMIGRESLIGTWSVESEKLIAAVEFQGKTKKVECTISGKKVFYKDKEIARVN